MDAALPSRKETVQWWAKSTSVVGPYRFILHPNYIARAVWLLLFLAALGLTIYQIALAGMRFAGYPYDVLVDIKFNSTLIFPSINLCNLNPYRKQALLEIFPDLYGVIENSTTVIIDGSYTNSSDYFDPPDDDDGELPTTVEPETSDSTIETTAEEGTSEMTTEFNTEASSESDSTAATTTAVTTNTDTTTAATQTASDQTTDGTVTVGSSTDTTASGDVSTTTAILLDANMASTPMAVVTANVAATNTTKHKQTTKHPTTHKTPTTHVTTTTPYVNVTLPKLDALDAAVRRDWENKTDNLLSPTANVSTTPEYDLGFYVIERIQKLPDVLRERLGHLLEAMLIECYYIGLSCSPRSFKAMLNWRYGNCYTFNSGFENIPLNLSTARAGPDFGLSLVLLVESEQQVKQLSQSLGIRLTVQEQLRVPFPEDDGVSMSTGSHWGVAVTRMESDRLKAPYFTCAEAPHDVTQPDLYKTSFPNVKYSRETCEKSTVQAAIIKRCLCADATYPRPNGTLTCSRFNQTQADCVGKVQTDFSTGVEQVNCPAPCAQVSYDRLIHSATWPSASYWEILRDKLAARFPSRNFTDKDLIWARDNLVKIDIYYKGLNYERIFQQISYSVDQLLSDIGGVFSFWMGFCILSFFEVLELIGLVALRAVFFSPKVSKPLEESTRRFETRARRLQGWPNYNNYRW